MLIEQHQLDVFKKMVEAFDTIIIHRHVNADPDALGSQLGLKYTLQSSYPNKNIYAVGEEVSDLLWLGQMDTIEDSIYRDALVIITDTANQERIDDQRYELGEKIIKIDHHLEVDCYGDLQITYPEATSASQLITEIVQRSDSLFITDKAAECLYAGIVSDTGRFLYDPTDDTFMAAAYLINFNVDARAITDRFSMMDVNEARFHGYAFQNLTLLKEGVAYLIINQDTMAYYGVTEDTTQSVLNIPSQIEGIYSWVNFIELKGDQTNYRVRLRSKGPEINSIAVNHGGGGHAMASGANAYSEDEIEEIIDELKLATQEYKDKKL